MSKARNMARMGQDTSVGYTGAFDMPAGTTAERPASAGLGWTRLNTDTGSVEVYDGTNWNSVTRPFIASVTGTIYAGAASNLVIAGQNFTDTITVRFLEGGSTVADVAGVTVTSGSATVAVPAAVYGQTAGDSIQVKVLNSDGTTSTNEITEIVVALPTGGTITTSGGFRYHTFTSSSNLDVPSGFSATANYLVVAGGGGGGTDWSGGGGAGGYLDLSTTITGATVYTITVGAGGAASPNVNTKGSSGVNSSAFSQTAIGGGGGGSDNTDPGLSGGSGGGGAIDGAGGSGTGGQGNAGGSGTRLGNLPGGGGGGAGATGTSGGSGGAGGNGLTWSNGTTYAGGGGGGNSSGTASSGGSGGGGNGGTGTGGTAIAGTANRGGGGGGGGAGSGAAGGSGIVIVRYAL